MSISAFSGELAITKAAVSGPFGVVAAQNQKAAAVGAAVLEAGGNAIDAAIATSLALAATEPWMSGLGGIGTMLVQEQGEGHGIAIDFGAISPRKLDPAAFPLTGAKGADLFGWPQVVDDRNIHGVLSIAVPGQVAGLAMAHEHFASMPWRDLVQPAIALAEEGIEVDWWTALITATNARDLRRYEASAATWLPDGLPPVPDSMGGRAFLPLGLLPETLAELALEGPRSFYEGGIAARIVADMKDLGGWLDAEDLRLYRAHQALPLVIDRLAGRVLAMPGPFAGTTLRRCLELLGGELPAADAAAKLAIAKALRTAYRERLSGSGAGEAKDACTSHLCVVDRNGMLVSLTQTLLSVFGSRVVLPSTGMLMNNGINWFDPRPGGPNSMAPATRPLSNMCPVIGVNGSRRFALGASGGRKILPAVLQLTLALMERGMELGAAFAAPRIDVSGPEAVAMDRRLPAEARAALAKALAASEVEPKPYPLGFACPSAVMAEDGLTWGAAEPHQPWAGAKAAIR